MIPYYSPNITFKKILFSFISPDKSKKVEEYFKKLTGKKYVLLTNSARAAIYLSYKALEIKSEVITSPLTCRSALDPIIHSGQTPVFVDIDKNTLNIDTGLLKNIECSNVKVIQVIHHGGMSCNMDDILAFAQKNKLIIIEDCAQSFKATYKGKETGSFGDIACFSLIKNAYGIGGGVLATNDKKVYEKAKNIQNNLTVISRKKIFIRLVRAYIESHRTSPLFNYIHRILMKFKNNSSEDNFFKELKKPRKYIFKIFYSQLTKIEELHKARKNNALQMIKRLQENQLIMNYSDLDNLSEGSFSKLFVFHESFNSKKHIKKLNAAGIEVMHLEHSYGSSYQERLDNDKIYKRFDSTKQCKNYLEIHGKIISLPLYESKINFDYIIETLKKTINENNLV